MGKRRNVYNSIVDPTYVDYPPDASDFVPESPYGGIDLPPDEVYPFLWSSTSSQAWQSLKTTFQASISTIRAT